MFDLFPFGFFLEEDPLRMTRCLPVFFFVLIVLFCIVNGTEDK